MQIQKLTGYPSVDKPWLKYYSEEAINLPLPECTMYEYIYNANQDNIDRVALNYYGTEITYGELFQNISKVAGALENIGVKKGDMKKLRKNAKKYCLIMKCYLILNKLRKCHIHKTENMTLKSWRN